MKAAPVSFGAAFVVFDSGKLALMNTICVNLEDSSVSEEVTRETIEFFQLQGIKVNVFSYLPDPLDEDYLAIELKRVPTFFNNSPLLSGSLSCFLQRANNSGISLYYVYYDGDSLDGGIFIPMSNVVSIRTLSRAQIHSLMNPKTKKVPLLPRFIPHF